MASVLVWVEKISFVAFILYVFVYERTNSSGYKKIKLHVFVNYISTKIVNGLHFHCSLPVCLCACVCLSVNIIQNDKIRQFGRDFLFRITYRTGSNPIKIGDIWLKVKVRMTQYIISS